MRVSDLIARFLEWQEEHNKPATVRFYQQGLRWVLAAFGDKEWADLKRDDVKEAMRAANRKKDGTAWKANTQRRNILCFGQLQTYAIEQYDQDPVLRPKDMVKPAGDKRERIPTYEELDAILKAADAVSAALGLAFRSLVQSGMRPNELQKARIEDLNRERDLLLIKDHKTAKKTGKPRRIALAETMQVFVRRAIGERTTGPIWTDESGKAWSVQKLSHQFTKIRRKLGLSEELVLYSFRHFKGTEVARNFGIQATALVLGHTQLTTSARYCHLDDNDLRKYQEGKPEEKKPVDPKPAEPKDSSDDQDTQGGVKDAA